MVIVVVESLGGKGWNVGGGAARVAAQVVMVVVVVDDGDARRIKEMEKGRKKGRGK